MVSHTIPSRFLEVTCPFYFKFMLMEVGNQCSNLLIAFRDGWAGVDIITAAYCVQSAVIARTPA
jgi:hypothetical protein